MDNTTKAVRNENGVYLLIDDRGTVAVCPFATRVLVPVPPNKLSLDKGPGIGIDEKPCASNCPHFRITTDNLNETNFVKQAIISCIPDEIKMFNISEND